MKQHRHTAASTGDVQPTVTERVTIPFLRALLGGFWFAVAAGIACLFLRPPDWWVWMLAAAGFGGMLLWFEPGRIVLWLVERKSGVDLDLDGQVGEPEERTVLVNVPQAQEEAAERYQDAVQSRFSQWVMDLDFLGTAERASLEYGIPRDQYAQWRDALLRLGWARWRSHDERGQPHRNQGWELVLPAEEIVRRIK